MELSLCHGEVLKKMGIFSIQWRMVVFCPPHVLQVRDVMDNVFYIFFYPMRMLIT